MKRETLIHRTALLHLKRPSDHRTWTWMVHLNKGLLQGKPQHQRPTLSPPQRRKLQLQVTPHHLKRKCKQTRENDPDSSIFIEMNICLYATRNRHLTCVLHQGELVAFNLKSAKTSFEIWGEKAGSWARTTFMQLLVKPLVY